jgi:type II secretion system protein G
MTNPSERVAIREGKSMPLTKKTLLERRGFTLIELLVVAAIISILAAIALPNFLEAQTRARVGRVKADFKALQLAVESYCADHGTYPSRNREGEDPLSEGSSEPQPFYAGFAQLTSPIAYISMIPHDPMGNTRAGLNASDWRGPSYGLGTGDSGSRTPSNAPWEPSEIKSDCWELEDAGPDRWDDTQGPILSTSAFPWLGIADVDDLNATITGAYNIAGIENSAITLLYDPTNGSISMGQIMRFGGQRPTGKVYDFWWDAANQ